MANEVNARRGLEMLIRLWAAQHGEEVTHIEITEKEKDHERKTETAAVPVHPQTGRKGGRTRTA